MFYLEYLFLTLRKLFRSLNQFWRRTNWLCILLIYSIALIKMLLYLYTLLVFLKGKVENLFFSLKQIEWWESSLLYSHIKFNRYKPFVKHISLSRVPYCSYYMTIIYDKPLALKALKGIYLFLFFRNFFFIFSISILGTLWVFWINLSFVTSKGLACKNVSLSLCDESVILTVGYLYDFS